MRGIQGGGHGRMEDVHEEHPWALVMNAWKMSMNHEGRHVARTHGDCAREAFIQGAWIHGECS